MSEPSRIETLAEIFRQEALDHRNRAAMREGDPLRLSSVRLQWCTWGIVALLAGGLALAGSIWIDDFASGPAVVHFESAGEREAPASCLVVGYLPARHLSAIRPGEIARFAPALPAGAVAEIRVKGVEPDPLPADTVRRLLNDSDPKSSLGGEAMVTVLGRLEPCAVMSDGRRVQCAEGLKGSIEVRLQPRRLISALVPGSSIPSVSDR